MNRILMTLAAALLLVQPVVGAAVSTDSDHRSERVHFARGMASTVIKGQIRGYRYVDYQVRAGAGQALSIEMQTSNAASYFNILPPDSADVAMFNGSLAGNRFSGVLPADGDYSIRVYLMRSAARRNESARYMLIVGVSGQALAATLAAEDALIPGTPFNASAKVACTVPFAPKVKECDAFVIRRGFDGTATVEVRWARV